MIRIYQWRTRIFSTEVFIRRRRPFINQHPFLTGKKKSSNSLVGVKILDDIWSLQSACFGSAGHVTSQISIHDRQG